MLARDIDASLYAHRLDHNEVYPIAAKALRVGGARLERPEQIADVTVVVHRDMPETFEEWRRAAGVGDVEPLAVDHFDSGQLMLDAAALGLGVAFMHGSHFDEAHDDRLFRPFDVPPFDVPVVSPYSYWFVCRPRTLETRPVRLFHDWLIDAVGASAMKRAR